MRDALVPLATFDTLEQADPLRRRLLAAGIPVIVSGGGAISLARVGFGPAFGAIRILVAEPNRDRALEILANTESPEPEETSASSTRDNRNAEELVSLATVDLATVDPVYAQFLVQDLLAMGINASVYDDIAESYFLWTGSRVGKARIVVLECDLERALDVLHRRRPAAPEKAGPSTGIRPPINGLRSASSAPSATAKATAIEAERRPGPPTTALRCSLPSVRPGFRSILLQGARNDGQNPKVGPDAVAKVAFRAAIQGLFLFPPLLHFYSTFLLGRMLRDRSWKQLTENGKALFFATLVLNLVTIGAMSLVVGFLLAR